MNSVIKGQFYQGILYNSFVKFHGKKLGNHNMTMLYPIFVISIKVCY